MNVQTLERNAPAASRRQGKGFVEVIDVVKKFGDAVALNHVNLTIEKNELFALLGSSGCGKSTLLRILAGFETATEGKILIDGEDLARVPPYHRPVNMMFQSYALFPHMTVERNVAFGLRQEGVPRNEITERVNEALDLVQMRKFAQRKPHQLSGGQQQRVALARSLVKRPKLLLLDEPMSALDKKIRQQTQFELMNILGKVGVTCVMVTHDQEEAMTMADRLAVMSEGEVVQIGEPTAVYEFPNSRFSAEFIGSTNLFDGVVVEDEPDHVYIESASLPVRLYISHGITGPLGMDVSVSVRPERVVLSRAKPQQPYNWVQGVVKDVAYMGSYALYRVELGNGRMVTANVAGMVLSQGEAPSYGEEVFVSWNESSGVVLTK
ncbi:polyamine ABC transporter ATP-binding protein [Crenobacter sp. SG2305]|uniref:ABC transporter ATP-binding protein n=1 Tax=Crenobacter oryzisoli TaxID=3056844 RepID=UPI0025AA5DEB|nr:polyamine ABC transporter ATP-binding protein [Crenobacter sp. SG2305]MDN0082299.1 polyamine ABC transporter ATP-binding protein [Crenobacter sp. SG2305]